MRNDRMTRNLNAAISTMKDACENAAQAVARESEAVACQRVLHALAWGFANASSSIETAMAAVEDDHAMQVELLNMRKDDDGQATD